MSEVIVSAPARLHLGMLDPAGLGRRRFGGFGVAVGSPRVVVAVRWASDESSEVTASGPQADRAAAFGRSVQAELGISRALTVEVREAIPAHVGLGSGTKLGLAVARGIFALVGRPAEPELLTRASGRAARSSVGTWTFVAPGLVVEAGVSDDGEVSPLLMRCRCRVVAVRAGPAGRHRGPVGDRRGAILRRPAPSRRPSRRWRGCC